MPSSPFGTITHAACSPFGTTFVTPTTTTLTFERKTESVNSAGELMLAFASALTVTLDLQPKGGGYPRFLAGTMEEINFTGIVFAAVDVRVADRALVPDVTEATSGAYVEVVNVQHFGTVQTELNLKWVR